VTGRGAGATSLSAAASPLNVCRNGQHIGHSAYGRTHDAVALDEGALVLELLARERGEHVRGEGRDVLDVRRRQYAVAFALDDRALNVYISDMPYNEGFGAYFGENFDS
jgi:hypothetical protein